MKETLRGDFATIPGLLAGPAPEPALSDDEMTAAEEQPAPNEPPPADQLGFFG